MTRLDKESLSFTGLCWAGLFLAAALGALVRVLPWMLEPTLPASVVWPFARSLLLLAAEVSLVVAWPLGWALHATRLVERGEARVFATLGEAPSRTAFARRMVATTLVLVLGALSLLGGRDASAPGLVVQDLLDQGRSACAAEPARASHTVPLVKAVWTCVPGYPPRLVGKPPMMASGLTFSASAARVSPDLTRFELDDARILTPPVHEGAAIVAHVRTLVLRGIPPFAASSTTPPWVRALVLALATALAAHLAFVRVLTEGELPRGVVRAVVLGVVGPLAALFLYRRIETASLGVVWLAVVPLVAGGLTLLVGEVLSRLPRGAHTGTK